MQQSEPMMMQLTSTAAALKQERELPASLEAEEATDEASAPIKRKGSPANQNKREDCSCAAPPELEAPPSMMLLQNVCMRPGWIGRSSSGTLRVDINGLAFVPNNQGNVLVLDFNNILSAFYQPYTTSKRQTGQQARTFLHFHLRESVQLAKSRVCDLQFYKYASQRTRGQREVRHEMRRFIRTAEALSWIALHPTEDLPHRYFVPATVPSSAPCSCGASTRPKKRRKRSRRRDSNENSSDEEHGKEKQGRTKPSFGTKTKQEKEVAQNNTNEMLEEQDVKCKEEVETKESVAYLDEGGDSSRQSESENENTNESENESDTSSSATSDSESEEEETAAVDANDKGSESLLRFETLRRTNYRFKGVPLRVNVCHYQFTTNCLVQLEERPFMVMPYSEMEVVYFARVRYKPGTIKNFDITIVPKNYMTEDVTNISFVPMESLEDIETQLALNNVEYYEGHMNLVWKRILQFIREDREHFLEDGGWTFLDEDGGDEEEREGKRGKGGYDFDEEESEEDEAWEANEEEEGDFEDEEEEEEERLMQQKLQRLAQKAQEKRGQQQKKKKKRKNKEERAEEQKER